MTGYKQDMLIELIETLKRGNESNTDKENYKLWVDTWVFPKLKKLIPNYPKEGKSQKEEGEENGL